MKIFTAIDLEQELIQERKLSESVLDLTQQILSEGAVRDQEILSRLKNDGADGNATTLQLSAEKLFSLEQIKNICIRYRLRFLDSKHFKAEYPYEAIQKINAFERENGIKIKNFKIIAPDQLFQLENINKDPLLFAELGNDKFYLLHKWGNDLEWHRRILSWPLQSFGNFFVVLTAMCIAFAFVLPSSLMHVFNPQSEFFLRAWLSVHMLIAMLGMTFWFGLTFNKTFSSQNWNSKYYNY
jgi:hypothetical protein